MQKFELPSNIKQIGSIGEGIRIYVEDYVCTYLKQYAETGEHCERIAFLVGRYLIIDSQPIVFVNGAIQGKYCNNNDGVETFTEKSFLYAEQQIDKYFKGFEIVGWMQSQPGYSVFLNPSYAQYHMTHFKKPYHMLFVMDPLEKMNVFYVWDEGMDELVESKGYFVYYDKNPGMQEYMIDNKLINLDLKEKAPDTEKIKVISKKEEREALNINESSRNKNSQRKIPVQASRRSTSDLYESKRLINMLVSLSAVLFVISFIMGAGLVQNDGRINELEDSLQTLNNTYLYLVSQVKQGSTQSVFASQDDKTQTDTNNQIIKDTSDVQDDAVQADILTLPNEYEQAETLGDADTEQEEEIDNEPETEPQAVQTEQPTPEPSVPPVAEVINIEPKQTVQSTYIVQEGDSLNSISVKFYGTAGRVKDIMKANDITDPDKIYFGKVLVIPE